MPLLDAVRVVYYGEDQPNQLTTFVPVAQSLALVDDEHSVRKRLPAEPNAAYHIELSSLVHAHEIERRGYYSESPGCIWDTSCAILRLTMTEWRLASIHGRGFMICMTKWI